MYLQKVISKNCEKKTLFSVGILKATDEKSRIRVRTKMSRIHNTWFEKYSVFYSTSVNLNSSRRWRNQRRRRTRTKNRRLAVVAPPTAQQRRKPKRKSDPFPPAILRLIPFSVRAVKVWNRQVIFAFFSPRRFSLTPAVRICFVVVLFSPPPLAYLYTTGEYCF